MTLFLAADMRQTKKITVSAMAVALSVLIMAFGAFVEVMDLTVAAITTIIMMFVFVEVGKPYTYFVWLGTSILSFAFFPQSLGWLSYFVLFGIYPILKAYIERTPRPLWFWLKLIYFLVGEALLVSVSTYILGNPLLEAEMSIPLFAEYIEIFTAAMLLALLCALFVYDIFMTIMIRAYFSSIRRRIERFLK